MKTIHLLPLAILIVLVGVVPPAWSADGGYVGGAFALAEARQFRGDKFNDGFFGPGTKTENEDETFRVYGGLQYGDYFRLELGYADLGTASFTAEADPVACCPIYADGPVSGEVSVEGVDLVLLLRLPIADTLSVTTGAGLVRWSSETHTRDSSGPVTDSDDKGTDLRYGAGLQLKLFRRLWGVVDYSIYKLNLDRSTAVGLATVGPHEVRFLSFGLQVPFGMP